MGGESLERCLREQRRARDEYLRGNTAHGGPEMGIEDWVMEEVLLMKEVVTPYGDIAECEDCYYDTGSLVCLRMAHGFAKTSLPNPKDLIGEKKVSLTKLPPIAMALGAAAMMDGAKKYGPYNWREHSVQAHIYVDAALRHLLAWFDREETAEDSGVHHLGHALACCAILLDAQSSGKLIDDRPQTTGGYVRTMKDLNGR